MSPVEIPDFSTGTALFLSFRNIGFGEL